MAGGRFSGMASGPTAEPPLAAATPAKAGVSIDFVATDKDGHKAEVYESVNGTGQKAGEELGKKLASDFRHKHLTKSDPGFDQNSTYMDVSAEMKVTRKDGTAASLKLEDSEKGAHAGDKAARKVGAALASLAMKP